MKIELFEYLDEVSALRSVDEILLEAKKSNYIIDNPEEVFLDYEFNNRSLVIQLDSSKIVNPLKLQSMFDSSMKTFSTPNSDKLMLNRVFNGTINIGDKTNLSELKVGMYCIVYSESILNGNPPHVAVKLNSNQLQIARVAESGIWNKSEGYNHVGQVLDIESDFPVYKTSMFSKWDENRLFSYGSEFIQAFVILQALIQKILESEVSDPSEVAKKFQEIYGVALTPTSEILSSAMNYTLNKPGSPYFNPDENSWLEFLLRYSGLNAQRIYDIIRDMDVTPDGFDLDKIKDYTKNFSSLDEHNLVDLISDSTKTVTFSLILDNQKIVEHHFPKYEEIISIKPNLFYISSSKLKETKLVEVKEDNIIISKVVKIESLEVDYEFRSKIDEDIYIHFEKGKNGYYGQIYSDKKEVAERYYELIAKNKGYNQDSKESSESYLGKKNRYKLYFDLYERSYSRFDKLVDSLSSSWSGNVFFVTPDFDFHSPSKAKSGDIIDYTFDGYPYLPLSFLNTDKRRNFTSDKKLKLVLPDGTKLPGGLVFEINYHFKIGYTLNWEIDLIPQSFNLEGYLWRGESNKIKFLNGLSSFTIYVNEYDLFETRPRWVKDRDLLVEEPIFKLYSESPSTPNLKLNF